MPGLLPVFKLALAAQHLDWILKTIHSRVQAGLPRAHSP